MSKKKKLTRERLRQIIREEKQRLNEVLANGVDRFYVVAVKNENGDISVMRDTDKGMFATFATKITNAQRFETPDEAEKALERLRQSKTTAENAYVTKVRAELQQK